MYDKICNRNYAWWVSNWWFPQCAADWVRERQLNHFNALCLSPPLYLSLLGMRGREGKEIGRAHSAKSLKVYTFAEAFYSIFFGTRGWLVGFHPHSIDWSAGCQHTHTHTELFRSPLHFNIKMDEFIYLNRTRVAIFSLSVRESAAFFEETQRKRERERVCGQGS